jgi:hypothetical protein
MAPEDRAQIQRDQQTIAETIERNQEVLRDVQEKEQRYSETLQRSGVEIRNARHDLRRAGYL